MDGINWLNTLDSWNGSNFSPLDEPRMILNDLGNPQDAYDTIHVAGTNGKGSVVSYLTDIYITLSTYKNVAKMTSPHIFELTERAQINNSNIATLDLNKSLIKVQESSNKLNIKPTYFVAITCAIFLAFKELNVDIAIIETGLGGRFDVTNLIKKPLATIITSIGYDHENILGDTLGSIAWNKAGIIKNQIPIIIGPLFKESNQKESFEVIQKEALEKNSPLILATESDLPSNLDTTHFADFQIKNAALAASTAKYLGVNNENILQGLQNSKWQGRFEKLENNKNTFILDVAHNEEGIKALFREIKSFKTNVKQINLVIGVLERKLSGHFLLALKQELKGFNNKLNLYLYSGELKAEEGGSFYGNFADIRNLNEQDKWFSEQKIYSIKNLEEIIIQDFSTYVLFGSTYFYPLSKSWVIKNSDDFHLPQPETALSKKD